MKQGLFSWDSIWLTFFGNVYMGWFELLLIYYYYPCPCPKRELHLWRFHGKPWLMYCCCGCAKVQLVSCSLQPVGNQVIVFRGELCWSHKSSDKNLKWCTNLRKCTKSWIVAEKCFYNHLLCACSCCLPAGPCVAFWTICLVLVPWFP